VVIYVLHNLDRQIINILAEPIRLDWVCAIGRSA